MSSVAEVIVDEEERIIEMGRSLDHLVELDCVESRDNNKVDGSAVLGGSEGDMPQHPLCPGWPSRKTDVGPGTRYCVERPCCEAVAIKLKSREGGERQQLLSVLCDLLVGCGDAH